MTKPRVWRVDLSRVFLSFFKIDFFPVHPSMFALLVIEQ